MNKTLLIATLASVVGVMHTTSPVMANEVTEQSQAQKLKIECTTGSYGQSSTCKAEGEQKQAQKIVYRNGKFYHKPVDTALDTQTAVAASGIMVIGLAAYLANKRVA